MSPRVAFVVQRYGPDIIGGSEWYARTVAEKLVSDKGYKVEVFTTTSEDYVTWAHTYREGQSCHNGVVINRFRPDWQRSISLFNLISRCLLPLIRVLNKIPLIKLLSWPLERCFLILQGPYCPLLVNALKKRADDFDRIFFMTYLYYPTIYGLPEVAHKAVLIPTAHNEPPFFFQHVERILKKAPMIFANTVPEQRLILKRAPKAKAKLSLAGIGLNLPESIESKNQMKIESPYILYLGRVSKGKGVSKLIEWFSIAVKKHPNLKLILAGKKDDSIKLPSARNIQYLGFVSEEEKYQLIQRASCLINPSQLESLSIIVVEAMMLKVPVIVNGRCDVLKYYADETDSVYSYHNFEEFKDHLSTVLSKRPPEEVLEKTKTWATEAFSWQRVLSVFEHSLGQPLKSNLEKRMT